MAYHPMTKLEGRARRKIRVRKKIFGTATRPRLSVFRSSNHIYAQVINDENSTTLCASSSLKAEKVNKSECAKTVGQSIAELCKAANISEVVFDRNGFKYHGRVKALAEGAREAGLTF